MSRHSFWTSCILQLVKIADKHNTASRKNDNNSYSDTQYTIFVTHRHTFSSTYYIDIFDSSNLSLNDSQIRFWQQASVHHGNKLVRWINRKSTPELHFPFLTIDNLSILSIYSCKIERIYNVIPFEYQQVTVGEEVFLVRSTCFGIICQAVDPKAIFQRRRECYEANSFELLAFVNFSTINLATSQASDIAFMNFEPHLIFSAHSAKYNLDDPKHTTVPSGPILTSP